MKTARSIAILAISAIVLASCQGEASKPADSGNAAASAPASGAAGASPGSACAPVKLGLVPGEFAPPQGKFAEGTPERAKLEADFARAYAEACAAGWLAKRPLIDPAARPRGELLLFNAPDANTASIYMGEAGEAMVLEYPFVDGAAQVSAPDAETLKEAIYCSAVGATEKEQEESGRCLVD